MCTKTAYARVHTKKINNTQNLFLVLDTKHRELYVHKKESYVVLVEVASSVLLLKQVIEWNKRWKNIQEWTDNDGKSWIFSSLHSFFLIFLFLVPISTCNILFRTSHNSFRCVCMHLPSQCCASMNRKIFCNSYILSHSTIFRIRMFFLLNSS